MFGIIADLISSVLTILFPIFASYKALRTRNPDIIVPWLMYWVVIAAFALVDSWTYWFVSWLPFYSWLRLAFLSYLVLPQTQGAKVIYQAYLDPWLFAHEDQIEQAIGATHQYVWELGVQYTQRAIDWVRERLGLPPIDRAAQQQQQQEQQQQQQQQQPQPGAAPSATALASALLARFNMPNSGAQTAAADGQPANADLFSQFASGLSGFASRVSAAASGSPRDVMPPEMRNASSDEQAAYLRRQKEDVANLLRAYDDAQHNLSNASGVNAGGPEGLQRRRGSGVDGMGRRGSGAQWN